MELISLLSYHSLVVNVRSYYSYHSYSFTTLTLAALEPFGLNLPAQPARFYTPPLTIPSRFRFVQAENQYTNSRSPCQIVNPLFSNNSCRFNRLLMRSQLACEPRRERRLCRSARPLLSQLFGSRFTHRNPQAQA
jgi:hypothetical protein